MHERLSVHQMCFPGMPPARLRAAVPALGAQRIGFIGPALLAPGGLTAGACGAGAAPTSRWRPSPMCLKRATYAPTASAVAGVARLARAADRHAAELDARSIYMLTGGHGELSWEEAADVLLRRPSPPAWSGAKAAGIELAIENASALYADLHIAHSLADTITLAEMADVGVCIELFFCWAEAGLPELFARTVPRCRLVQISDYVYGDRSLPARAVPGDGVIPLQRLVESLLDAGYAGAFDLELLGPRIDAEGGAMRRWRAPLPIVGAILTHLNT